MNAPLFSNTLRISATLHDRLLQHLNGSNDHVEQAAFLLTSAPTDDGTIEVRELQLIKAEEFEIQSSFHISLIDTKRAELIRWAWEAGGCLFEVHSHLGGAPAQFSASDLSGFEEWVPHLWWRLGGRPYGAVVVAGEGFDGLVWRSSPQLPEQLHRIVIDDGRSLDATGRTLSRRREAPHDSTTGKKKKTS